MEKIFIDLGKDSYYIHIEKGILRNIDKYIENTDKLMIITDENVDKIYGQTIREGLKIENHKIVLEPGEESKTLKTVEEILSKMLDLKFTRNSKILALGGGVVGDIAGFTASIYMRGISFLQVPTTLLSQVDSSVGGKTGVNLPGGKNMVGSFYQPERVLIDIETLKTLPKRDIRSGLGEIIKYGIIWDYEFLKQVETEIEDIEKVKEESLKNIIGKCCKIKAEIVSKDEKEEGLRKILNHGHTIGHALETITNYKHYSHGEAILIGIYYEALMAKKLGLIAEDYLKEIKSLIESTDIDLDISKYSKEDLLDNMMGDKKNKDGKISFILLNGRGSVEEIFLDRGESILVKLEDGKTNIALIGFMATGKTSVGRELAKDLGVQFIDIDRSIEKEMEMSIAKIFEKHGEKHFREIEKSIIKEKSGLNNMIISCGGGVCLNPENIENIKKNGTVVLLEASPEDILKRTRYNKKRPLLEDKRDVESIEKLMDERRDSYHRSADIVIDTSQKSIEEVRDEILKLLNYKRKD